MDVLSFFGAGPTVDLEYNFIEQASGKKKFVDVETDKGLQKVQVFTQGDLIKGNLKAKSTKTFDHVGIKLQLIGEIVSVYDRGEHNQFLFEEKVVSQAGTFPKELTYEFDFPTAKLEHDSYNGVNAKLRYYLCFIVTRSYAADIIKENDLWVINYNEPPPNGNSIRMEVGIEDCLHIEFEYERTNFHLQDIVLGKIFFLLVRLKIKYMEIVLIKRETTGNSPNFVHENVNITKFEIMDGAPVKGGVIPVRLLLGALPLTPTYKSANNKFSVKYALNMVLVDEEDRRYFKQTDIFLWRERPENLVKYEKDYLKLDYVAVYDNEKKKEKKKKKKGVSGSQISANNSQTKTDLF
jgi:hypothetical protein